MTKTKFTQGPWELRQDLEMKTIVTMPNSKKTKYGTCFYAAIGGFDTETQSQECNANAYLIAAAPDLYECLEVITNDDEVKLPKWKLKIYQNVTSKSKRRAWLNQ